MKRDEQNAAMIVMSGAGHEAAALVFEEFVASRWTITWHIGCSCGHADEASTFAAATRAMKAHFAAAKRSAKVTRRDDAPVPARYSCPAIIGNGTVFAYRCGLASYHPSGYCPSCLAAKLEDEAGK